jgi:hypothetical protein
VIGRAYHGWDDSQPNYVASQKELYIPRLPKNSRRGQTDGRQPLPGSASQSTSCSQRIEFAWEMEQELPWVVSKAAGVKGLQWTEVGYADVRTQVLRIRMVNK